MSWKNKKIKPVSVEEFFSANAGAYTFEEFAEKIYLMMHTYYLTAEGKIKDEMEKTWEREFGKYMSDETFEYMVKNEPVMVWDVIVDDTRQKVRLKSSKYLRKAIVAFEFDLWLIENYRLGQELKWIKFEKYIIQKYGAFIEDKYISFRRYDLKYIRKLENLAKGLDSHYDGILKMFRLFVSNNKMDINYEKESTSRTESRLVSNAAGFSKEKIMEAASKEVKDCAAKAIIQESAQDVPENHLKSVDIDKIKSDIKKEVEKEFRLVLKEKDERIELLEKDIREFKRQRDESREYSANQYDKGIKDLFITLNDVRYGKVIDYLYALMRTEDVDENLASYLDNLFMALEDMEIEPVIADGQPNVNEETMLKEYNLDFNKAEYVANRVKLKYAGWRYKETLIEKPTITLKEE